MQDKPAFLQNPNGILIKDVIGLQAALDALAAQSGGGGSGGGGSSITFGSAAFCSASIFATSAQGALADTALQPGDVTGTANEITATPSVGDVIISLPTALTFTGKTVTGGTFNATDFNGPIGGTTRAAGAFTVMSTTGNATIGLGGTGTSVTALNINGDNGANGGPILAFHRNSSLKGAIGTQSALFGGSSDDIYITQNTSGNIGLWINGVTVGLFSATGLTLVGALVTSAPNVGAAGSWKLGKYTAGVVVQAGKVRVNIDGTDYDLLTA